MTFGCVQHYYCMKIVSQLTSLSCYFPHVVKQLLTDFEALTTHSQVFEIKVYACYIFVFGHSRGFT